MVYFLCHCRFIITFSQDTRQRVSKHLDPFVPTMFLFNFQKAINLWNTDTTSSAFAHMYFTNTALFSVIASSTL